MVGRIRRPSGGQPPRGTGQAGANPTPPRVGGLAPPRPPARAALLGVARSVQDQLVRTIEEWSSVTGSGQDNGGGGNLSVNERRAALSVLSCWAGGEALAELLPKGRGGQLLRTVQADLRWLERAEQQALTPGRAPDLGWAANGTSTPAVLRRLARRRAELAAAAAQAIAQDPSRAYDAQNDDLSAHLELADPALRAQMLGDCVVQFRARRRSTGLMDQGDQDRDGSVGRIASSGALSTFEQRLACQALLPGDTPDAARERALLRLAVTSHPHASTNGIFRARNAVSLLAADRYLGLGLRNTVVADQDGLRISLYNAIHKEYSANTPRVVEHFLRHQVYTAGAEADRLPILSGLIAAAGAEDLVEAQRRLELLGRTRGFTLPAADRAQTLEAFRQALYAHLLAHTNLPRLKKVEPARLPTAYRTLVALHDAMAVERPSEASLRKNLFYAQSAWPAVAALIHTLERGDHLSQLDACGRARQALARAFEERPAGWERQMVWRLDRQVELLSAELLGASVGRLRAAGEHLDRREWATATLAALRGTLASGLDAIRARPRTAPAPELGTLLDRFEALVAKRTVSEEALRSLSLELYRSASEAAESLRGFFRRRALAVHFSRLDVEQDPDLVDGLVKESALHGLLELAQIGMSMGQKVELSAEGIRAVPGLRVLSSIGPAVFRRVLIAKDLEELDRFRPGPDDFCVVRAVDEKSMVAMGGLLTDSKDAPPGYCHLSVFARGHGISALAVPELFRRHGAMLRRAHQGGGLFVDDRPESFAVLPLAAALREGRLRPEDQERLRPGFNHELRYYAPDGALAEAHRALRSVERETRTVELYLPDLEDREGLRTALPFDRLRALGAERFARMRHLAGEKGAVLAHLAGLPELAALGVVVPGGASIPPYRVAELLRAARVGQDSLWDRWNAHWQADPTVGAFTPENFTRSRFFQDPDYREQAVQRTKREVQRSLLALLLDGERPSAEGRRLLAELERCPDLGVRGAWIARSSFTGEDRPFKSGAGQYDSFAGLATAAARLRGIAGVITSAWNDKAVGNNVALEVNPAHVFPAVLVQPCLKPTVSGVAYSRGKKGELGQVSYQAVPGSGGGVGGGKAEEGTLKQGAQELGRRYPRRHGSLLTPAQAEQLRQAVLVIEREFQRHIEPGQGFAVDVEWALAGGKLHVVQARVLVGGE